MFCGRPQNNPSHWLDQIGYTILQSVTCRCWTASKYRLEFAVPKSYMNGTLESRLMWINPATLAGLDFVRNNIGNSHFILHIYPKDPRPTCACLDATCCEACWTTSFHLGIKICIFFAGAKTYAFGWCLPLLTLPDGQPSEMILYIFAATMGDNVNWEQTDVYIHDLFHKPAP